MQMSVEPATAAMNQSARVATSIIQSVLALGHIQSRIPDGTWSKKIGALLPTITGQDGKNNGGPAQFNRNTLPLNALVGGPLNPEWCEWLMGFPIGWTALSPLEMHRLQQWQRLHSEFYQTA